ncbi:ATP-dependent zinc protease [Thioalkalivibrio sp. AKL12]|uniref:ATP-dependent zinc protease family protein n=1 Tax=Thioalkalivibrio sp. AKL12 TaxID=1158159 RepID=UPI000476A08A|nr:ATP-dependent zinc protease [Thioalkalivibrio sp. AKL12]
MTAPAARRSSLTQSILPTMLLVLAFLTQSAGAQESGGAMAILGVVENVRIAEEDVVLEARMDTGATSSSLNALNKERFEKDGEDWIRFEIIDPDDEDARITLERPIERIVRIRRHSGDSQERPVVRMEFCIGDQLLSADTSLIDRTALKYQALIGRSHMAGHILVDSGAEHLRAPDCATDDQ